MKHPPILVSLFEACLDKDMWYTAAGHMVLQENIPWSYVAYHRTKDNHELSTASP